MTFLFGVVVGFAVGWVLTNRDKAKRLFNQGREWVAHKLGQ